MYQGLLVQFINQFLFVYLELRILLSTSKMQSEHAIRAKPTWFVKYPRRPSKCPGRA